VDEQATHNRFVMSNAFFASQHQLDRGIAAFPYIVRPQDDGRRPINVWFATAWIGLGGLDQIVLKLAAQLAAVNPSCRVHLVVTDAIEIEADPRSLNAFDTVTFLHAEKGRKEQVLLNILSAADVVVNAHSRATYDALRRLKSELRAPVVSLLQVSDLGRYGVPRGYPIEASRRCEPLIDYFVVPSRQLRRACMNLGVPEDKLVIIPNAPVVRPQTLDEALTIAQEKAQRVFSEARPMRILFAGRFDEQKGFDRLGPIIEQLRERGVPVDFRIVGKAVLSQRDAIDALPDATLVPATHDPATLARYYTDADVFLLPSRWEGVPLSVLDAMAFGNVVVTTDVGATGEVVVDGSNGFLVDAELSDEDIITSSCRVIAGIASHALPCHAMREEAVRTALSYSWRDSAAQLATLIENLGLE
jgi:glycosyltransferase involved in cell wall biosynthesis